MKKKIQKPFVIEDAKNGAKVETRDGKAIRILCYDKVGNNHPIVALLNMNGVDCCASYTIDGKLHDDNDNDDLDLVIIEEVEETKFNVGDYIAHMHYIYKLNYIDTMYHTYHLVCINDNSSTHSDIEYVDKYFHKWSLTDAKPGDVLISEDDKRPFIFKDCVDKEHPESPVAYCGINEIDKFIISTGQHWWTSKNVRPATYKERQQFFNRLEEEGYKWDAESLTVSKIQKRWRDNEYKTISGYYTHTNSCIIYSEDHSNTKENYNLFATEKQVKSALAMARISQIMANDERFGGVVTDKEWKDKNIIKFVIRRMYDDIICDSVTFCYNFLAFHTEKQAKLFLEENEDLVKDYYMMY